MLISDFKHGLFKYEVKDYYAILGVPINQDPKEIRKRYLRLAYQLHPDTNQAKSKEEKDQASSILSKVLNPAYENLQKPKLRKECELILGEISKRLVDDINKITLNSEIAKKLLQENSFPKLDKIYNETITKICKDQYKDLNKIGVKVGLLSELNLIYLLRTKQNELSKSTGRKYNNAPVATSPPSVISASAGSINQPTVIRENTQVNNETVAQPTQTSKQEETKKQEPVSRLQELINSAKRHLETANYEPAMFDLREAVKEDANSAVAHALLGKLYLEQRNKTYAKIHINKAVSLDKDNPEVKTAKEKLDKIENRGKKATKATDKKSAKKSGDSKKKGKKGDKKDKKEAPKIFGIPLW